eukprot:g800.t1
MSAVLDSIVALAEQINTNTDDWEKRADALLALQEIFAEHSDDSSALNIDCFRALKDPFISTLTDLRSGLVKEACATVSMLAEACGESMRPLAKEIIPVLIDQHGCGNKVTIGHVTRCQHTVIKNVLVRTVIPQFLDNIKTSRSKERRGVVAGARCVVHGKTGEMLGVVQFVGNTQFADGLWVGVELDEPNGKNNGTLKGVVYFETDPNHGLFCRLAQLDIIDDHNLSTSASILDDSQFSAASASSSPDGSPQKQSSSGMGNLRRTAWEDGDDGAENGRGASGGMGGVSGSLGLGDGPPEGAMGLSPLMTGGGAGAGAAGGMMSPEQVGSEVLAGHRLHIDEVLEALREEMELLAEFEKFQENASAQQVMAYANAIEACLEQRAQMSESMRHLVAGFKQQLGC